jgi:hypothetical protein
VFVCVCSDVCVCVVRESCGGVAVTTILYVYIAMCVCVCVLRTSLFFLGGFGCSHNCDHFRTKKKRRACALLVLSCCS